MLTPFQIGQFIPITFFLIIVRMAMLRFNDRTGQSLFKRTGIADRLPIARHMMVHIDRMQVLDSDITKTPECSSTHVDVEGGYNSKYTATLIQH